MHVGRMCEAMLISKAWLHSISIMWGIASHCKRHPNLIVRPGSQASGYNVKIMVNPGRVRHPTHIPQVLPLVLSNYIA